jgi:hypothetical protein
LYILIFTFFTPDEKTYYYNKIHTSKMRKYNSNKSGSSYKSN